MARFKVVPATSTLPSVSTATRILGLAERLAQTRGFNGFSYADIAEELNITKASLHYHFATKAALGVALIDRYSKAFAEALARIDATSPNARAKLKQYVQVYRSVLVDGRMCLCGMLAAEYATLPSPMQAAIRAFFDQNEAWLKGVFATAQHDRTLAFSGSAIEAARLLTAALEGAMLLARSYDEADRFSTTAAHLVRELVGGPVASPSRTVRQRRATRGPGR